MPRRNFTVFGLLLASREMKTSPVRNRPIFRILLTVSSLTDQFPEYPDSAWETRERALIRSITPRIFIIRRFLYLVFRVALVPQLFASSPPRDLPYHRKDRRARSLSLVALFFRSLRKTPDKPSCFQDILAKNEYYNTVSQAV